MDFYTEVRQYGSKILFRGIKNGQHEIGQVKYQPTLFMRSKNKLTDWKSLYGDSLDAKKFDSIKAAKDFIEQYKDVVGFEVHGMEQFQYQFIAENYPGKVSFDVNQMRIYAIDIEVIDPSGNTPFPDIELAEVPIVLISYVHKRTGKTTVFGWKNYREDFDDSFDYLNFEDEKSMLIGFINTWKADYPDIYTGWNTESFDTPYLINRIRRVLDDAVNSLSPFGIVRERTRRGMNNKEFQTYEIYGIVELDYLSLYKKFTFGARESFALGFISEYELGETKLEIVCDSFYDAYQNHYQKLVKYNAIDSQLVIKLDNKMKLLDLILSTAYMAKCNIVDVFGPVKTWDVFIYNFLLGQKIAPPPKKETSGGSFEGAWVKEPVPGMYGWMLSFDATSLYPTIIRQWNMSPETYVEGYREPIKVLDVLSCEEGLSAYAFENNYSVAANGTFYRKDSKGVFPSLMEYLMTQRKVVKKEMLKLEQEYQDTHNSDLVGKISALNNEQMAIKILANSGYGAITQSSFRYYVLAIGEAITLSGQACDRHLEAKLNVYMNKLLKTENKDYVVAGDTDSVYLDVDQLVRKVCKNLDNKDKIVDFLEQLAVKLQDTIIKESTDHIFDLCNCYDSLMSYKLDTISSKAIWTAKKRYCMLVHSAEFVRYHPPKLKIMGMDIIKASTPKAIRNELKASLPIIFEDGEVALRKFVEGVKTRFFALPPESIAFPRGVNDIDKWTDGIGYKSGTPIHVRSAINYNNLATKLIKYDKIRSGDKIKFVYLRVPNVIHENIVGFPSAGVLPPEFGLHQYIDKEKQFIKAFISPLKSITDAIGWELESKNTLEDFFS